jgi:hypothetical protein
VSPEVSQRQHLQLRGLGLLVALGAVVLGLQLWLFQPLLRGYFPTNDEVALIAASTNIGGAPDYASWFTQGFHDYFQAYADFADQSTNFVRPLANFSYWLCYSIFGKDWTAQLVIGYLAHAAVVVVVGYIAFAVLDLTFPVALAAILIAFLNPAYWSRYQNPFSVPSVLQFPIYQTEVMATLLILMAFLAMIRRQYLGFAVCATGAILLKETALTVPISALMLTGVWIDRSRARSIRNAFFIALPLVLWAALRLLVFQPAGSVYPLQAKSAVGWLGQPIRNLLLWPTGLFDTPLRQTFQAVSGHSWNSLTGQVAELAVNAAWWAALIAVVARECARSERRQWLKMPAPWVCALAFAAGNLVLVIVLPATHVRYGYLWFALGPAALFAGLPRTRLAAVIVAALTFGLAVPQLRAVAQSLSKESIAAYLTIKQSGRQLTELIGHLPDSIHTVFIIDDLESKNSSPKYLAKLAGYKGTIVFVNSILPIPGCNAPADDSTRYLLRRYGETTVLTYRGPACFEQVAVAASPARFGSDRTIVRNASMVYSYPDLIVGDRVELGGRAIVQFKDPGCAVAESCVWLGFAPAARSYYPLQLEP